MKKPKSKAESAETPVSASREDLPPWEPTDDKLPTTEQLALIAAVLARNGKVKPELLTQTAMELWLAAWKTRRVQFGYEAIRFLQPLHPTNEQLAMLGVHLAKSLHDDPKTLADVAAKIWYEAGHKLARDAVKDGILFFKNAPPIFKPEDRDRDGNISRDQFFRRVLPPSKGGRKQELEEAGKAFLSRLFRQNFGKEPTAEELNDSYKTWNPGKPKQAHDLAMRFQDWYRDRKGKNKSIGGRASTVSKLLNKCPHIDEEHKEQLRKKYNSIQLLCGATLEQLTEILGSKPEAEKVKAFLEKHGSQKLKKDP